MTRQVLGLSTPLLHQELKSIESILSKWRTTLEEEGIPGVDYDAPPEILVGWVRNFIGEMQLASDKASSVSIRLLEGQDL